MHIIVQCRHALGGERHNSSDPQRIIRILGLEMLTTRVHEESVFSNFLPYCAGWGHYRGSPKDDVIFSYLSTIANNVRLNFAHVMQP